MSPDLSNTGEEFARQMSPPMTDDERVRKLSEHLLDWLGPVGLIPEIAEKIIANPKAHMDALVEAGVLEFVSDGALDNWWRLTKPFDTAWQTALRASSTGIPPHRMAER
jgi:hypothetical protein